MGATQRRSANGGAPDEANRRADIVRAAARLFHDKGFEATTVRDIAGAVGMQSGSPFYHFDSKHEILLAVIEQGLRATLERTERAIEPGLPAEERFRALVLAQFEVLHAGGRDYTGVMLNDWRSLPSEHRQQLADLRERLDSIWQRTLEELHVAGRIGVEPKLARLTIQGAINCSVGWYRRGSSEPGALDLDALADATASLFLKEPGPEQPRLVALRNELQALRAGLDEDTGAPHTSR